MTIRDEEVDWGGTLEPWVTHMTSEMEAAVAWMKCADRWHWLKHKEDIGLDALADRMVSNFPALTKMETHAVCDKFAEYAASGDYVELVEQWCAAAAPVAIVK